MNKQPEALRLAKALEQGKYLLSVERDATAAELRRLHQFAEDQIGRATTAEAALQMTKTTHALKIAAVEAQRDALLEALKTLPQSLSSTDEDLDRWMVKARAAIKAALAETERPATLTKPCGSLGEDVSPCRYPDCVGGQAGTVCHSWCPGK